MYIECKQSVECLDWLTFLELRIYHIAKLKLYKFPTTQCIQCTVLCYVYKLGHGHDKLTNIVTLAHKVWVDRIKGVVLSRLTFKQSPHSID